MQREREKEMSFFLPGIKKIPYQLHNQSTDRYQVTNWMMIKKI